MAVKTELVNEVVSTFNDVMEAYMDEESDFYDIWIEHGYFIHCKK